MGWTTPASWTVAEEVTSAALNAQLRDNLNWLHDPSRYWCRAYLTGSPAAVADGTNVLVPLNTVDAGEDPSAMFNVTTHLVTIPAKGLYQVTGTYRFTPYTTQAKVSCGIYKNTSSGPPSLASPVITGNGYVMTRTLLLQPGDTVGLNAWQNSGAALSYDLSFGGTSNQLQVACLSLQP